MANKYEVHKILVISTAHITEETASYIEDAGVLTDEYGHVLWTNTLGNLSKHAKDLAGIYSLAKSLDCKLVNIDRDGPVYEGLEVYDW